MSYRHADAAATAGRLFDRLSERFGPDEMFLLLANGREFLVALLLAGIVWLAGAGWVVSSWGAYRDAFQQSRARSLAALLLAIVVTAAGVALIGFMWRIAADHG